MVIIVSNGEPIAIIEFLQKNYGIYTNKQLAEKIKKEMGIDISPHTIAFYAVKLGLRKLPMHMRQAFGGSTYETGKSTWMENGWKRETLTKLCELCDRIMDKFFEKNKREIMKEDKFRIKLKWLTLSWSPSRLSVYVSILRKAGVAVPWSRHCNKLKGVTWEFDMWELKKFREEIRKKLKDAR